MRTLHRLATAIYFQPWLIESTALHAICQQFETAVASPKLAERLAADDPVGPGWTDPRTGKFLGDHPQVEVMGNIALVQVYGIIGKHLGGFEMMCGGYDIGLFQEQIENITEDPAITKVIIDFRSPGGTATGVASAAAAIDECRAAGKKCYAYTSDICASAAYWLASRCDEIHAERSAMVGSISAVLAGVDDSAAWVQKGLVRKVLATGDLKAIGCPGKAWTADEEAHLWSGLNALHAEFTGAVKERRPDVAPDSMRGQAWQAANSPAGIVDSTAFPSIKSFIEAVALS